MPDRQSGNGNSGNRRRFNRHACRLARARVVFLGCSLYSHLRTRIRRRSCFATAWTGRHVGKRSDRSDSSCAPTAPARVEPKAILVIPALNRAARAPIRWRIGSSSQQHTDRLGQAIGWTLRGGETIARYGPLGAGKTALVRGIARGLGAESTAVTSPTF